MIRRFTAMAAIALITNASMAQTSTAITKRDTVLSKYIQDVTVVGRNSKSDYQQMPEIVGTNIYAGKKNALIVMDNVQANVVTNNMRQILAKVPGIHVWESDPSGIQVGIAARGLSPNRSWEFNIRQNGYDIAADPFGYPEAYYNPQMQAVQRIEVVRGSGALQYGAQFGGMVNYILRNGSEISKPFEFETQQTLGSYNLVNSYNAIGGNTGKVHYYAFFDHRNGDGYRKNSRYNTNAGYGTVTYNISQRFSLTAELMHSQIRSQQAGGLTDNQLYADPQQSFRSRNWFDIKWTNPALTATYQINDHARWTTKLFATIGDRNSVGFLQPITVADTINAITKTYNNRSVTIDQYRNYGLESRILTDYTIGKMQNTVSAGVRLYTGSTYRRANGKGTTGEDYDLTVIGNYPRDITFKSKNAAVFVENIFRLSDKLSVIPGVRYEWLEGSANGRDGFNSNGAPIILQDVTRSRAFLLGGIGAEYHITPTTELYANAAQAYRPIQFANLQAPPTTDVIDPNLKDAKGYNLDLGYRGKIKNYLQFDVSGFYLQYNNRVGAITVTNTNTNPTTSYRLVTNIGASTSKGVETFVEFSPIRAFKLSNKFDVSVFSSYSHLNARYSDDFKENNTKGKEVENAPSNIFRGGLSLTVKNLVLSGQLSHVGQTFSDANNTVVPTANAQNGQIPSYTVTDLTVTYAFPKGINLKTGINNLTNERYFTRRAGGYPGPGALPADGRTFFVSIGAKF